MSDLELPVDPVVLVVAPSGYYRNSLVALLGAIPRPQRVLVAADLPQADSLAGSVEPDLILLASSPHRASKAALQPMVDRIRRRWPQARLVLLADSGVDTPAMSLADVRLRYNASAGDLVELFGDPLEATRSTFRGPSAVPQGTPP